MVDNVIESEHYCWGDGRCNQFMNSTKYGYDGGDCLRENAIVAKCNDMDCCDDKNKSENFMTNITTASKQGILETHFVLSCYCWSLAHRQYKNRYQPNDDNLNETIFQNALHQSTYLSKTYSRI